MLTLTTQGAVATLTLNRPDKHNAFDDALIAQLTQTFQDVAQRDDIRVLVLTGAGASFCAGADLAWMKKMRDFSEAENRADATQLSNMLQALDTLPQVTIARVNGQAFGGALGLIACCDLAVAVENARFCFSEVKLGIAPATIAPYVVRAIGVKNARRYCLTAERFNAASAQQIGLVNEVCPTDALDTQVQTWLNALLHNGPHAMRATKALLRDIANPSHASDITQQTIALIARLRVSAEGQEGLGAFFEGRPPAWSAGN